MLRSVRELKQYAIGASDGLIGVVADCFFDDRAWVLRYLVVTTGPWLAGRKVLIPPRAIGRVNANGKILETSLSRVEVKGSPVVDTDEPPSRQHESRLLAHYGYAGDRRADDHLRSCNAVVNYRIHASDGAIGPISGILIDEASWAIRHLVVDTGVWGLGHQVLLAPEWIRQIDWAARSATVDMARQVVRDAPAFEAGIPTHQAAREYEAMDQDERSC